MQFSDFEGWSDSQDLLPYSNKLKQLSGSLEYSTPQLFISQRQKHQTRNSTNEKTPTQICSPKLKSVHCSPPPIYVPLSPQKKQEMHYQKIALPFISNKRERLKEIQQIFQKKNKSPEPFLARNKLERLAPILCKVRHVQTKNRIITITQRSPITQLSQILQLINT